MTNYFLIKVCNIQAFVCFIDEIISCCLNIFSKKNEWVEFVHRHLQLYLYIIVLLITMGGCQLIRHTVRSIAGHTYMWT